MQKFWAFIILVSAFWLGVDHELQDIMYYDNMPTEYMEGYNMASQDPVGLLLLLEEMKDENPTDYLYYKFMLGQTV